MDNDSRRQPGKSPGNERSIFDRWGNLSPKIPVEPGAGQQAVSGLKLDSLPKTKSLPVPKNGAFNERMSANEASASGGLKTLPRSKADSVAFNKLLQAKNPNDGRRELNKLRGSTDPKIQEQLKHWDTMAGSYQERLAKVDSFQGWRQSKIGQELDLDKQFKLQQKGDVARSLGLSAKLVKAGGWAKCLHGPVGPAYTTSAFSTWYGCGGGCFPAYSWCPTWSPWVAWSWWNTVPWGYYPYPYWISYYPPCLPWNYWLFPVWQPLYMGSCGCWIDVPPVVMTGGLDLQLLAVRFKDNGYEEKDLGPCYRVFFRNNSPVQITTPFSVLLLASNERTWTGELPQAGVVVPSIDSGQIMVVDIRLPKAANRLRVTPEGYRVPFTYLTALVDAHRQIPETLEDNNGAVLACTDILPIDPAAFSTDHTAAAPESSLTIAGEGFGPGPGQVIVSVYGKQVQAVIDGWYDNGVHFTVPNFQLTKPVDAEVLVVRGDKAAANSLTVRLAPHELLEEVAAIPEAPIPSQPK